MPHSLSVSHDLCVYMHHILHDLCMRCIIYHMTSVHCTYTGIIVHVCHITSVLGVLLWPLWVDTTKSRKYDNIMCMASEFLNVVKYCDLSFLLTFLKLLYIVFKVATLGVSLKLYFPASKILWSVTCIKNRSWLALHNQNAHLLCWYCDLHFADKNSNNIAESAV